MPVIVSTICTPPYEISKYLADIIQQHSTKPTQYKQTQGHLFRNLKHGKVIEMKFKFHVMLQTFIH